MNDDVRILRTGSCPSLSGLSDLDYEFGYRDKDKKLLFRISENSGSGHFNGNWVSVDDILQCLHDAKDPFSLDIFKGLYPNMSINNTGFLGAALKKEGLIVNQQRQYIKKDTKTFLDALNKLIKAPPKKKSSKKTTAKGVSND